MGRPRKQPRRIVTFNLNLPLADAIDEAMLKLPPKRRNRSEWMNKNLPAILEDKEDREERVLEEISDEELFSMAESRMIANTFSESRLIVLLLGRSGQAANATNIELVRDFLSGSRPRKPFNDAGYRPMDE